MPSANEEMVPTHGDDAQKRTDLWQDWWGWREVFRRLMPGVSGGLSSSVTTKVLESASRTSPVLGTPRSGASELRGAMGNLAHGYPRFYLGNSHLVYAVLSSRARGLSIGVNLNPDKACNFNCCYCEVQRDLIDIGKAAKPVDAATLAAELSETLVQVCDGSLLKHAPFASMPAESLRLAHVAISGDGEPTLCPNFSEAVESVIHLRAAGITSYFRLVLLTNGSAVDHPSNRSGIRLFTRSDEIWMKFDTGTQAGVERINRTTVTLSRIMENIVALGRQRPVVLQSLFVEMDGAVPDRSELVEYGRRLVELKQAGAQIALVQIYSATRPHHAGPCRHLSLRVLSEIATFVRGATGLRVEVF